MTAKPRTSADWLRPGRLLPLILILLAIVGFYQLWSARTDRALSAAERQLADSQLDLQATLRSATAQLDLIKLSAEQELSHLDHQPASAAVGWLRPVAGRPAFATVPPASTAAATSNLTLAAPLPEKSSERAHELAMAARMTPLFASVKKNLANATWIYYFSKNKILAIYPYEKGSIVWSDDLLENEIFTNAAPDRNPARGIYWSDIYVDTAGKGLMSSVVDPVFDRHGDYHGVVACDLTVDTLIAYIKGDKLAIGTPLIINRHGQLLAHPTLISSADKEIRSLADTLPAELRPASQQLIDLPAGRFAAIGGFHAAAFDLGPAPWRLLFLVDRRSLALATLADMHLELLGLALLAVALVFFLKADRLQAELARLAVTDPLTGLANRRRFGEVLRGEIERSRRSHDPFALIMLDIDHFKTVNDTYGHNVGDKVIAAIADELGKSLREIDTVGRLGGEEFAAILPETGLEGALAAAERVRLAIAARPMTAEDGSSFHITISIGVTVGGEPADDQEEILRRADSTLYASKHGGRNKVTAYSPDPAP